MPNHFSQGRKKNPNSPVRKWSLPAMLVVGVIAAGTLVVGFADLPRRQRVAAALVAHTLEVLGRAEALERDVHELVSEGRAFIIATNTESHERFEVVAAALHEDITELRALTVDNPVQQNAIDRLDPILAARLDTLRDMMRRMEGDDPSSVLREARTRRGRVLTDRLISMIDDIKQEEKRLLVDRNRAAQRAATRTLVGAAVCGVIMAASVLFAVTLLLTRGRERMHLADLRAINADLERRVRERTAELVASASHFRMLTEQANDMVSRVDRAGERRYVSPAALRIFGVAHNRLLGRNMLDLIVERYHPVLQASMKRLLAGEIEQEDLLYQVRWPNGRLVWVESTARVVRDEAGLPDGYVSVSRDVTARYEAEAALKVSEERYRVLANGTSDAITLLDADLRRTYASPAFKALFGYDPEEVLGNEPTAIAHPEDAAHIGKLARQLASGEAERAQATYRIRHKLGHWVWTEVNFSLVRDGVDGAPSSIICALRDISERRAQAEELRATNQELERLTRRLAEARDKAELASAAKTRFLAGMSHELRTPLNGILGYAQLLRLEGGLSVLQDERLHAMLEAGQHLLQMINRVLDLSEIEQDRLEMKASAINLNEFARGCVDLLRPVAAAKELELELSVSNDLPAQVTTDPTRLRQIVINLLGNGVKYTPRGSVELRFVRGQDRRALRVEVADTGPGIASDQRDRLFQDFARLEVDEQVEGAGLGLSLSSRLAAFMGGRLGYSDNPGGGSVFWLELPVLEQADPRGKLDEPDHVRMNPPIQQHGAVSLKVLVADDVAMNRDVAAAFLRRAGHVVECVPGGAEAVAAVANGHYQVVLMDVRMPGVDGLEATRQIRALPPPRGRVPIVAVTAQAFAEQVEECRRAGMDDHMSKPFTHEGLLATVTRAALITPSQDNPPSRPADKDPESDGASDPAVFDRIAYESTAGLLEPSASRSYLQKLRARVDDLLTALESGDVRPGGNEQLADAAHTIAGSASMFGLKSLAAAARRFEYTVQRAPERGASAASDLVAAIQASRSILDELAPAAEGVLA